jgi:hypothetical protein
MIGLDLPIERVLEHVRTLSPDQQANLLVFKSGAEETIDVAKVTRDVTAQMYGEERCYPVIGSCPSRMVMIENASKICQRGVRAIVRLPPRGTTRPSGRYPRSGAPVLTARRAPRKVPGEAETRRNGPYRRIFGEDGAEFAVEVGLNPIQTHDRVLFSVTVDISVQDATK